MDQNKKRGATAWLVYDWTVHVYVPTWLSLSGWEPEAISFRSLPIALDYNMCCDGEVIARFLVSARALVIQATSREAVMQGEPWRAEARACSWAAALSITKGVADAANSSAQLLAGQKTVLSEARNLAWTATRQFVWPGAREAAKRAVDDLPRTLSHERPRDIVSDAAYAHVIAALEPTAKHLREGLMRLLAAHA